MIDCVIEECIKWHFQPRAQLDDKPTMHSMTIHSNLKGSQGLRDTVTELGTENHANITGL